MKNFSTEAFVLKFVNYKDNDRIVTFYTRSHGKVCAIARGARNSRKRFAGALEPFSLLNITLGKSQRGHGDLYVLSEAEVVRGFDNLATDLESMGVGAFILELTKMLTPENHADLRLFELIHNLFVFLCEYKRANPRLLALSAGLKVFEYEGVSLIGDRCNACGLKLPPGKKAMFDPQRGGIVCTPCGGGPIMLSSESAAGLSLLCSKSLEEAFNLNFSRKNLLEIEAVFDAFCERHLEFPLKTALFRAKVGETAAGKVRV